MNNQFFDSSGVPVQALRGLLDLFGLVHDGSLADIVCVTQQAWYERGKLRADIQEKFGDKRHDALPFLTALGFVEEIWSKVQTHDHAFVLGAKKAAIRKRLSLLRREWNSGIRFTNLVMCGSQRPNDEDVTDFNNDILPFSESILQASRYLNPILPADETDLMEAIYELSSSTFGWSGRVIPLFKKTKVVGRNANTRDTLTDWGTFPTGKVLIVSSQPFVSYQAMIAKQCLFGCQIEAIGAAATATLPISVYLDNLAKILFELAD